MYSNLTKILKEKNLSKLQLALKTGITPSDLYCALNGKKPLFPLYRQKIANFIGIDEETLFNKE